MDWCLVIFGGFGIFGGPKCSPSRPADVVKTVNFNYDGNNRLTEVQVNKTRQRKQEAMSYEVRIRSKTSNSNRDRDKLKEKLNNTRQKSCVGVFLTEFRQLRLCVSGPGV